MESITGSVSIGSIHGTHMDMWATVVQEVEESFSNRKAGRLLAIGRFPTPPYQVCP